MISFIERYQELRKTRFLPSRPTRLKLHGIFFSKIVPTSSVV